MKNIVLGTRGSELALAQTRMAMSLMEGSGFDGGLEERVNEAPGRVRPAELQVAKRGLPASAGKRMAVCAELS